ncbi:MAG: CYTH domain-containing protein [Flavobacteriaceae bacterium]|nr:CYTH domain-containing protein [Flavobacteriaceae bacterium]
MIEIERKFLVRSDAYKKEASRSYDIQQGFLNTDPERTVRIRLADSKGILTVKGLTDDSGLKRFEWEKEIDREEAMALLALCEPGKVEKRRYEVAVGRHIYEVDEFFGSNQGLVVAEIELADADEVFEKPDWLGEEVTGDIRYYNAQLAKKPFQDW